MILGSLTLASIYHMQLGVENEKSVTSAFTKYTKRMLPFADAASSDFPLGQLLRLSYSKYLLAWPGYALGHIKPCNDCRA